MEQRTPYNVDGCTCEAQPNDLDKPKLVSSVAFESLRNLVNVINTLEKQSVPTAKRAFVDGLEIGETLRDLNGAIDELQATLLYQVTCEGEINRAKKGIEEIKALKIVNGEIVGKNEGERLAAMTLALQTDAEYGAARKRLEHAESESEQTKAKIEIGRARISALKHKAALIESQLNYLAD